MSLGPDRIGRLRFDDERKNRLHYIIHLINLEISFSPRQLRVYDFALPLHVRNMLLAHPEMPHEICEVYTGITPKWSRAEFSPDYRRLTLWK